MELGFFIETIKSGGLYDILKIVATGSVKELSSQLKSIFNGQSLTEKDYTRIAEIMKEAYKKEHEEEGFIDYLKNSGKLKETLESKKSSTNVYQKTGGNYSPIINGNNNTVNYGVDPEKK